MIGKSVSLIALALALSVTGALAADPPAQPEKERQICRRAERSLGSHIRTPRRCRTAAQWQQEQEEQAKAPPLSLQVTEGQNDGLARPAPR
jgi:hypothetical protein